MIVDQKNYQILTLPQCRKLATDRGLVIKAKRNKITKQTGYLLLSPSGHKLSTLMSLAGLSSALQS